MRSLYIMRIRDLGHTVAEWVSPPKELSDLMWALRASGAETPSRYVAMDTAKRFTLIMTPEVEVMMRMAGDEVVGNWLNGAKPHIVGMLPRVECVFI